MSRILLAIAGIAIGASAGSAETFTVTAPAPVALVSYADLNLDAASGKTQLRQRIRAAAAGLCFENNVSPLDERLQRRSCFAAAVADGHRQADRILAARGFGTALATTALTIRAR